MLKIKEAIKHYNQNIRKEGQPKMTQKLLGSILYPEETPNNSENYITRLVKGNETIRTNFPAKLSESLKIDANFLFSIKPMKK